MFGLHVFFFFGYVLSKLNSVCLFYFLSTVCLPLPVLHLRMQKTPHYFAFKGGVTLNGVLFCISAFSRKFLKR